MELKAGTRLRSQVCATQVVVIRPPTEDVELGCGGTPLAEDLDGTPSGQPQPGLDEGTLLGKRYVDDRVSLEVLCTRAGAGSLTCDGAVLGVKDAKPLPSSD